MTCKYNRIFFPIEFPLKYLFVLQVLHLVRDPRAVTNSRQQQWTFASQFSFRKMNFNRSTMNIYRPRKIFDFVHEGAIICDSLYADITQREQLSTQYPGRIKEIVFEKFVENIQLSASDMYSFIGQNMPQSIEQWIRNHSIRSEGYSTKWQSKLGPETAKKIKEHAKCKKLYELTGKLWT